MIGVVTRAGEMETAREFFELFKTPWEPAAPGRGYRVALTTAGRTSEIDAAVWLVYGSTEFEDDREVWGVAERTSQPTQIEWKGIPVPVHGGVATFDVRPDGLLTCRGRAVDVRRHWGRCVIRRVGYDLFAEVARLLTDGQPAAEAAIPTLDVHIAILRQLLLDSRVSFLEVPPRPAGTDFICCLTHDVDFSGIRRHVFDRTLAGFAARASGGSLADLVRGRRTPGEAVRNWAALLSLPLVHTRLARDPWRPFDDYARVEPGNWSTFFVVPFRGWPGVSPSGEVKPMRAVPYGAKEIAADLRAAAERGSEIAVHGLDAWHDAAAGRVERAEVSAASGRPGAGVRMHWLYYAADSPRQLEAAGFEYDSTWGYNETVGYRAGTSQVFRLAGTRHLLELPLSIMDTALFYAGRMGLTPAEALAHCQPMVAHARRTGGTLVINWHDRSLAPERLWDRRYADLLAAVGSERVWFATAGAAVQWFRWRRGIRFERNAAATDAGVVVIAPPRPQAVPDAQLCIHRFGESGIVSSERTVDGGGAVAVSL